MIAKEERKRNLALGIRVRTSADSDTVALMRTRLGCSCWLGWPQHATVRAQQIGRPLPCADGRPSKIHCSKWSGRYPAHFSQRCQGQ